MVKRGKAFLILSVVLLIAYVYFCPGCLSMKANGVSKGTEKGTISLDDKYIIGPADVLEIQVWREPNLSCTAPVRPDGKISLPLLNDVQAAGLSPQELKTKIEKGLAKFLEKPEVLVSVQKIKSKNIYILGKVNTPGQYPLQHGLTVIQALSLAGGFAEWADEKNIVILRHENGKQKRIKFNYKRVSRGKDLEKNIVLRPGDTIIVP